MKDSATNLTDNPTATATRAAKDMDGYKVLRKAIPENDLFTITQFAKQAGVSVDTVYKWMRPPSTSKKPKATGRRNPVDYLGQVLTALSGVRPEGAEVIFDALDDLRAELRKRQGKAPKLAPKEIRDRLRQGAREMTQMADAIQGGSDSDE